MQYQSYVDWKYRIFKHYVLTPPKSRKGNGKRVAYRFTTRSLPVFTDYYYLFYNGSKKLIPNTLSLNALSMAVWYMDDGSKSRSACYLNSQQFSYEEQKILQCLLKKSFGFKSTLNKDREYLRIRISSESTKKLFELIEPYVLSCFRYKLGYDPVTTDPKGEALV